MKSLSRLAVGVCFLVGASLDAQTWSASPSSLTFTYQPGGTVPPFQNVTISSSPSGIGFNYYQDAGGLTNGNVPNVGTTNTTLHIGIDPSSLPATSFVANLMIFAPPYPASTTPVLVIPVYVNITTGGGGATGPNFSVTPSVSSSASTTSPGLISQTVTLSNTGSAASYGATISGPAGFSIVPTSGSVAANSAVNLQVSFNTAGKPPGVYTGTYTITATGTAQIAMLKLPGARVVPGATSISATGQYNVTVNGSLNIDKQSLTFALTGPLAQKQTVLVREYANNSVPIRVDWDVSNGPTVALDWVSGNGFTPTSVGVTASIGTLSPGGRASGTLTITCVAGTPCGSPLFVALTIGYQGATVPNVVGVTQTAATNAIQAAGLTVGTVTTASSATVPAGSVISQNPAANTAVSPGSPVDLVISSGPAQVAVPNVVGMTQTAATDAIKAAGLTVGTITTSPSQTVPAGSVIGQNPAAGAHAAQGSAVALTVSSGPDPTTPTISAIQSAGGFGGSSVLAPGTWMEIYGSKLAHNTRSWAAGDFNGANAPTKLDNVAVSIGGKAAFLDYISPGQINAQVPSDVAPGASVPVIVTDNGLASAILNVPVNTYQPGLLAPFVINNVRYAAAILPDGSFAVPPNSVPGAPTRPAKPGEMIVLFGIGFGPAQAGNQPIPAGQIVFGSSSLMAPLAVRVGQTNASMTYAGLAPSFVGLYQFNVVIPASAADNDQTPISFTLNGNGGTQQLYIAVRH